MRQANFIVIRKDYKGDSAIDNVIGYAIDSYHADTEEMLTSGVRNDSYDHMVEDFYLTQASRNMEKHRRLFHFLLTAPVSKDMQRILDEGATALLNFFESIGHQVVMVPHYSGESNCLHYHWHLIVNSVSTITGLMMQERSDTYKAIVDFLNLNTYTEWSLVYKNKPHK